MIYLVNLSGRSAKFIKQSFIDAGNNITECDSENFSYYQDKNHCKVFYDGQLIQFDHNDYVYIKSSQQRVESVSLLANVLLSKGVRFNDSINAESSHRSSKAFQSILLPCAQQLPFPKSLVLKSSTLDSNVDLINKNFDTNYVLKYWGSKGRAVRVITPNESLKDAVKDLLAESKQKNSFFTIQEIIEKECDYRVMVVNNKVLGTIKRSSDSFHTNLSKGGRHELVTGESSVADIESLGLQAAKAMNYDVAGVDIVRSQDGQCYIFEVNKNPGCRGFESIVIKDFAKTLLD